jgi:hypothetical protein
MGLPNDKSSANTHLHLLLLISLFTHSLSHNGLKITKKYRSNENRHTTP